MIPPPHPALPQGEEPTSLSWVATAATWCMCGPPWSPGNTAKLIFSGNPVGPGTEVGREQGADFEPSWLYVFC